MVPKSAAAKRDLVKVIGGSMKPKVEQALRQPDAGTAAIAVESARTVSCG